jgi:hypothetical protein
MHRHTTHWSIDGALHVGSVKDCAHCAVEHLTGAGYARRWGHSPAGGHHSGEHSA